MLEFVSKKLAEICPGSIATNRRRVKERLMKIARSSTNIDVLVAASNFSLDHNGTEVKAARIPEMQEIFEDGVVSAVSRVLNDNSLAAESADVLALLKQLPEVASSEKVFNVLVSSKARLSLAYLVPILELCSHQLKGQPQNSEALRKVQAAVIKAINSAFSEKIPLPEILQSCTRLLTSQVIGLEDLKKTIHTFVVKLPEEEMMASVCSLHGVANIHSFFIEVVQQLTCEAVANMCSAPYDHLTVLNLISKILSSGYQNDICYALLDHACLRVPPANVPIQDKLQQLMPYVAHWKILYNIRDNLHGLEWRLQRKAFAALPEVEQILRETAQSVIPLGIKCVVLQVLLQYKAQFLDICLVRTSLGARSETVLTALSLQIFNACFKPSNFSMFLPEFRQ